MGGMLCVFGSSQAKAFTATTTSGGKNGRAPVPGLVMESGKTLLEKTLAPFRDDLTRHLEALADFLVLKARRRKEDNLGPYNITIR
jgi:hypothetical protein